MSDQESLDDQQQRYANPGGMDAGGTDFDPGQQNQQVEKELASKMVQIQTKRFYLDVKQNRRGRFIKVAEIGADGRRSQIYLTLNTASEFRNHLSTFSDFYASLGPPNAENMPDDGKLKSEVITMHNRRYYLDLKENSRGRFLRVSQTITGGPRTQIAIPAQGMIEFRDALTDLLEEYGTTEDDVFKGDLPEGRHMRVPSKSFYFDISQNKRGIYMRISEVKAHYRSAITVPERSWARFRDIFADYCERMREIGAGSYVDMHSGSGGNALPEGRGSVVAQVAQKAGGGGGGGVKNKTEKRQADQRQREPLKRRKSLPRHAETSSIHPEKSMSAPASQIPTTSDISMSSCSAVTTSSTSKSMVSEENVSSGSTASQDIQGVPRLEAVQV